MTNSPMYALRTRFGRDIVAEFLPPARPSNRVVILCTGLPTANGSRLDQLAFFAERSFWAVAPRYRGTWESSGRLFKKSPHLDVVDVIDGLAKGFTDAWSGKRFVVKKPQVIVIGSSFGGAAALLVSKHPLVKRVIALSPVVDWREEGEDEPLDFLERFIRVGWGEGYRFDHADWQKLATGRFYNPATSLDKIDGKKIHIFCAKDDTTVPFVPTVAFAIATGSEITVFKDGGHNLRVTEPRIWRRVRRGF